MTHPDVAETLAIRPYDDDGYFDPPGPEPTRQELQRYTRWCRRTARIPAFVRDAEEQLGKHGRQRTKAVRRAHRRGRIQQDRKNAVEWF